VFSFCKTLLLSENIVISVYEKNVYRIGSSLISSSKLVATTLFAAKKNVKFCSGKKSETKCSAAKTQKVSAGTHPFPLLRAGLETRSRVHRSNCKLVVPGEKREKKQTELFQCLAQKSRLKKKVFLFKT